MIMVFMVFSILFQDHEFNATNCTHKHSSTLSSCVQIKFSAFQCLQKTFYKEGLRVLTFMGVLKNLIMGYSHHPVGAKPPPKCFIRICRFRKKPEIAWKRGLRALGGFWWSKQMRTRKSFWALIRSRNQNGDITPRSLQAK